MAPDPPAVPEPFRIDVEPHRATIVVAACGELDIATYEHLRRSLRQAMASGPRRVILDLRAITFVDLSGLRVILETREDAPECGVDFALIAGPAPVQRLFDLTGTTAVLTFVDAAVLDG